MSEKKKKKIDRSEHLAWSPKHIIKAKTSDRSDHMKWKSSDVRKIIKKKIQEELASNFEKAKTTTHNELTQDQGHKGNDGLSDEMFADHVKHRKKLSDKNADDEHNDVFRKYKNDSTKHFNDALRDMQNHSDDDNDNSVYLHKHQHEKYKHMDDSLNHETKHDMKVWRGFGPGFDIHSLKPGDSFQDPGYVGTSLSRHVGYGFAHHEYEDHPTEKYKGDPKEITKKTYAQIHVPKGTKGHYLDLIQGQYAHDHEKEFLLHRGHHFEVTGHSKMVEDHLSSEVHHHIVHLKVVKHEPHDIKDFESHPDREQEDNSGEKNAFSSSPKSLDDKIIDNYHNGSDSEKKAIHTLAHSDNSEWHVGLQKRLDHSIKKKEAETKAAKPDTELDTDFSNEKHELSSLHQATVDKFHTYPKAFQNKLISTYGNSDSGYHQHLHKKLVAAQQNDIKNKMKSTGDYSTSDEASAKALADMLQGKNKK